MRQPKFNGVNAGKTREYEAVNKEIMEQGVMNRLSKDVSEERFKILSTALAQGCTPADIENWLRSRTTRRFINTVAGWRAEGRRKVEAANK